MDVLSEQLSLENLFTYDLTIITILYRFASAAALAAVISLLYNRLNRAKAGNYIMMHTLIFLAVAIAGAMMIIGNNLARAFGLVGAVSIIRFRSAVKIARDMAFVLFVIVIGMAAGLGYILLAVILVLFGALLMFMLWRTRFGQVRALTREFELKITHISRKCSRVDIELALDRIALSWSFLGLNEFRNTRDLTYQFFVDDYSKVESLTESLRTMGRESDVGVRIRSL